MGSIEPSAETLARGVARTFVTCPACGSRSDAGKKFCGDCGALLVNICPKCGAENPLGFHIGVGDKIRRSLLRDLEVFDLAEIADQPPPRFARGVGHDIHQRRADSQFDT